MAAVPRSMSVRSRITCCRSKSDQSTVNSVSTYRSAFKLAILCHGSCIQHRTTPAHFEELLQGSGLLDGHATTHLEIQLQVFYLMPRILEASGRSSLPFEKMFWIVRFPVSGHPGTRRWVCRLLMDSLEVVRSYSHGEVDNSVCRQRMPELRETLQENSDRDNKVVRIVTP